ncbi:MAG: B12-binding domain-containing radical SAM protein [Desulfobacterales bacterium]|nr:B12-binding domain-containing radical SAM protein [Desulfobacterales bacterium]
MKYKNALCIYPYKQELKTVRFMPPIGLEYVASAIEDMVETVQVIDLRYEEKPLLSFIDEKTDLVLISHNWDVEEAFVKDVINSIPDKISVVVGGRYATEHVDELFQENPNIDGIVRGDGEEIVRQIVLNGISPDIDGLSFRSNGEIIHNRNRRLEPVRTDFFPNRKLRRYHYMVSLDEFTSNLEIDLILGSRGCPHNCKFCDFKFNPLGEKRKWSIRTPESVVSEIKTIKADLIGFADDIFTADMDWVERLCDLIISEGIKKKYAINARLEVAKRPDVLEKMYKAGFMAFFLGIESAHDKTLASMNKGFTTANVREYFEVLRRFNFIYHCYFIIGNIDESKEQILDIVRFSHELGVDTLGLSVLRATKYSPLKQMLKTFDHYHIEEDSGKVYSDMLSVDDLQQIRRNVNASFFTMPVILRVLRKMVIHRVLTLGRIYNIIVFIARRKFRKLAKKRGLRMGKRIRST